MAGVQSPKAIRQRERREKFIGTFRPYAERTLLPRLGLPSDEYDLELPVHGERSMVIFLRAAGQEFVVRCYPKRAARVRTARAVRKGLAYGVNLPRILYTDRSSRTRKALGGALVVEERVPGCHTNEIPDRSRMLGIVAEGVSRMHNVTRSRWGNLTVGRRRGYVDRQIQALRKHIRRAARQGHPRMSHHEDRIVRWLRGFEPEIGGYRRFNFSHRAIGPDNVVVTPDDRLFMIDVQRLCFEHFAAGLVRCLTEFCHGSDEEEPFLDAYFHTAEGRDLAEYRRVVEFFRVIYLARNAAVGLEVDQRAQDGTSMAEVLTQQILDTVDAGGAE